MIVPVGQMSPSQIAGLCCPIVQGNWLGVTWPSPRCRLPSRFLGKIAQSFSASTLFSLPLVSGHKVGAFEDMPWTIGAFHCKLVGDDTNELFSRKYKQYAGKLSLNWVQSHLGRYVSSSSLPLPVGGAGHNPTSIKGCNGAGYPA